MTRSLKFAKAGPVSPNIVGLFVREEPQGSISYVGRDHNGDVMFTVHGAPDELTDPDVSRALDELWRAFQASRGRRPARTTGRSP